MTACHASRASGRRASERRPSRSRPHPSRSELRERQEVGSSSLRRLTEILPFEFIHGTNQIVITSETKRLIKVDHLLNQLFVHIFRNRLLDKIKKNVVFLENVVAENGRQPPAVIR